MKYADILWWGKGLFQYIDILRRTLHMKLLSRYVLKVAVVMNYGLALRPVIGGRIPTPGNLLREGVDLSLILHILRNRRVVVKKKQHHNQCAYSYQWKMRTPAHPKICLLYRFAHVNIDWVEMAKSPMTTKLMIIYHSTAKLRRIFNILTSQTPFFTRFFSKSTMFSKIIVNFQNCHFTTRRHHTPTKFSLLTAIIHL